MTNLIGIAPPKCDCFYLLNKYGAPLPFAVEKHKGDWVMVHRMTHCLPARTNEQVNAVLYWIKRNKLKFNAQ